MVQGRFLALFFGDSIAWGQGLREEDKFSTALIQWINEFHPDLRAFKLVKARSGAVIGTRDLVEDPGWHPEIPSPCPAIQHQIDSYHDCDPGDADLVVLSGGINDVGTRSIFNPRVSPADLQSHIRYAFGTLMPGLLELTAQRFSNPKTKILVLGYYPIVSGESRPAGILPMMSAYGVSTMGPASWNPWRTVVNKALLFESESDRLIQQAIANSASPDRFVWVKSGIQAENAAFAPKPWVFGIRLPHLTPEDDLGDERRTLCQVQPDRDKRVFGYRASIGHPNRWGARAYFNAIYPVLQREYGF